MIFFRRSSDLETFELAALIKNIRIPFYSHDEVNDREEDRHGISSGRIGHQCAFIFFHSLTALSVTRDWKIWQTSTNMMKLWRPARRHWIMFPAFKRPASNHFQSSIYNSSGVPLNLPYPSTPRSHKLQSGRTGDGSVAWKGHRHPFASKWEPWLARQLLQPPSTNPPCEKHLFMF